MEDEEREEEEGAVVEMLSLFNQGVSTESLARPLGRSLAPLTPSLAP